MSASRSTPSRRRSCSRKAWTLCFVLGFMSLGLLGVSEARSSHPRAHPRVHQPSAITIDVIPRQRRNPRSSAATTTLSSIHPTILDRRKRSHSDYITSTRRRPRPDESIRISFTLPSLLDHPTTPRTIHLHLTPNSDLLHPDARIHHHSSGNAGEGIRSEPLRADELTHRGYHGHVVHPSYTFQRLAEDRAGGVVGSSSFGGGVLGWASLTVHEESIQHGGGKGSTLFEGAFQVDKQVYHVMSKENWERHRKVGDAIVALGGEDGVEGASRMVVFLEGDHDARGTGDAPSNVTTGCSHDRMAFNMDASHPVYNHWERSPLDTLLSSVDLLSPSSRTPVRPHPRKRDDVSTGGGYSNNGNFISSIGNTAGCPSTQQIIYMGVNADCNYVGAYGSAEAAKTQLLTNWNSISALYRSTFNVSLGLIEMNVANETCPTTATTGATAWNTACDDTTTLDDRLSTFSQWRGTYGDTRAGLYHLMSACPTNTEVGVAWLGTVCQTDAIAQGQYVSSTGVSTANKVEWSLISHEVGHNFGAIHDCTSGCSLTGSCCPLSSSTCDASGGYIMNPTTSSTEIAFSPCSEGNVCSLMQSRAVNTTCMQTPGALTVLSLQSCGNGIVEPGEECDPGTGVTSPCCDASTCKFTTGSVCDYTSDLCCTESCSFASNTTVCRPAVDETCDVAESCTGTSAQCPADVVTSDGTDCGSGGLACADGVCTSLDLQCQQVGVTLNLTQACNSRGDTSCLVTCQSVSSSTSCLVLQSPLIDGSPCGYGGHCYNQTCEAGSWQDTAGSWYRENLNISIPVTIVVGLLVLAILWGFLRCCFCNGRRRGLAGAPARKDRNFRRGRQQQAPPPMMAQQYQQQQQAYVAPPPPIHGGPYHQGPPSPHFSGVRADRYGHERPMSYPVPSGPAPWNQQGTAGGGGGIRRPQTAYYG